MLDRTARFITRRDSCGTNVRFRATSVMLTCWDLGLPSQMDGEVVRS